MLSGCLYRICIAACAVSISALSDRIAQRGKPACRGRGDHVSISALSDRIAQRQTQAGRPGVGAVSISALSDRIAQQENAFDLIDLDAEVSISALSDRIAQQGKHNGNDIIAVLFQYPLFRIELLSINPPYKPPLHHLFQYPLFRIELLSKTLWNGANPMVSVSISALSDRIAQRMEQGVADIRSVMFQYPLFRIELLSEEREFHKGYPDDVSISALSDRIAQPDELRKLWQVEQVSISALSDRIAQRSFSAMAASASLVSISALSDRIAQPLGGRTFAPSSRRFNIRSFGSNCSAICGRRVAAKLLPFQ